jgi:hypothetical protein
MRENRQSGSEGGAGLYTDSAEKPLSGIFAPDAWPKTLSKRY